MTVNEQFLKVRYRLIKHDEFLTACLMIMKLILCLSLLLVSSFASGLTLSSQDIQEGQVLDKTFVYEGFGCEGKNQSPHLAWRNAPKGTKSFVVTVYDPDAPTGSGWWHWVTFNIPADAHQLNRNDSAADKLPDNAVQSRTDFGQTRFGGACPPKGQMHRYIFTVYALSVAALDLDATASPALIGFMTRQYALASDSITAMYTR